MKSFRILALIVCCTALEVSAQTPPPEPLALPAPEPTRTERAPRVFRQPAADRALGIATNANYSGTNGELILEPPSTGVVLRAIGTTTPIAFETNSAERMRISESGKVSIGSSATNGLLSVYGSEAGGRTLHVSNQAAFAQGSYPVTYGSFVDVRSDIPAGASASGVIVGVEANSYSHGPGTILGSIGVYARTGYKGTTPGTVTTVYGLASLVEQGVGTVTNGYGLFVGNVQATNQWGVWQHGPDDKNYFAGTVGIGTSTPDPNAKLHVAGNIVATGNITGAKVIGATYQDLAEWVPASSDMAPGTVVVLNPHKPNEVMPSAREYDTTVAGVVSEQPGIILGVGGESKEQIATTGRVKVRVDAGFGAIRIGDLLATSSVSGTARRSEPVDIAGRKFHQPGTIIGKALENLETGTGEILVLLSLQ